MCEHFRSITQKKIDHSVGRHFNLPWYSGLVDVEIFVLQFGTNDQDSEASLTLRLSLVQMWIHRLRATAPLGLNVFDWFSHTKMYSQLENGSSLDSALICVSLITPVLYLSPYPGISISDPGDSQFVQPLYPSLCTFKSFETSYTIHYTTLSVQVSVDPPFRTSNKL